jgi:hypothetical protein
MSNKFIKPNWYAINKAVEGSKEDRASIWSEFHDLEKKLKAKSADYYARVKAQETADKLRALKDIHVGAEVYYNGSDKKLAFKVGKKIKDGIKYMVVDFGEMGAWKMPYARLQPYKLTDKEVAQIKTNVRFQEIANEVFNKG